MAKIETSFQGGGKIGERAAKVVIVSDSVKPGYIFIQCPNDIQQFEVPKGTKEFICPVDKTHLFLPD